MKNMEDYVPGYFNTCECCRTYGPTKRETYQSPRKVFKIELSDKSVEQIADYIKGMNKSQEVEKKVLNKTDDELVNMAVDKSLRGLEEKAQQINETRELLKNIQQKQREKEAEEKLQKEAVKKQKETYSMDTYGTVGRNPVDHTDFDKANETEIAMRALETAMADKQEEDKAEQKVLDLDMRIDKLETMMINMAMSLTEIKAILSTPPVEEEPVPSGPMFHINEEVLKQSVSGGSLSFVKAVATLTDYKKIPPPPTSGTW